MQKLAPIPENTKLKDGRLPIPETTKSQRKLIADTFGFTQSYMRMIFKYGTRYHAGAVNMAYELKCFEERVKADLVGHRAETERPRTTNA